MRKVLLVGVLLGAVILNGCAGTDVYTVGGRVTTNMMDAVIEHSRQLDQTLAGILPTTMPVGGRALLAIPTRENMKLSSLTVTGNQAPFSKERVYFVKTTEMNGREFMFRALQKRGIFRTVTLIRNDDPQSTPIEDNDFLIYLHNPSSDVAGWYIKKRGAATAQPITIDVQQKTGVSRTMSWLDSIDRLASVH